MARPPAPCRGCVPCAAEGCIPGLANLTSRRGIFDTVYHRSPSTENPEGVEPQPKTPVAEGTLHLPVFYDTLRTLDQTVAVDYYLPGCPPEAERIWEAVQAIVENRLPPPGSVIGSRTTVCDECKRTRNEKKVKKFHRTWQIVPDEETCLLEQGLLCCGIATRGGCGALCPQVNSPCIGCYGPNADVRDQGARMMSALASMVDSNDPEEIDAIIRQHGGEELLPKPKEREKEPAAKRPVMATPSQVAEQPSELGDIGPGDIVPGTA